MEITTDYGSAQPQKINTPGAERHSPTEGTQSSIGLAERADGGKLSGKIVELANKETPPVMTIKLPSGELIKGSAQPPIPSEAKVGEQISFTATASEGKVHLQNIQMEAQGGGDAQKLALMKSALDMAGLKPTENNMKLVSILLERELPINKESLQAISRMARSTGFENAEKAAVLMKNNITPTAGAMERLDRYAAGGRLMSQITALAESVVEMREGPMKQKLLQALSGLEAKSGQTAGYGNQAGGALSENGIPANTANSDGSASTDASKLGAGGKGQVNPSGANQINAANTSTAATAQIDGATIPAPNSRQTAGQPTAPINVTQAPQETNQAMQEAAEPSAIRTAALEQEPSTSEQALKSTTENAGPTESAEEAAQLTAQTGTKLFRDVFSGKQEAYAHLSEHPPSEETSRFIDRNLEALKEGITSLSEKGVLTKESVAELAKNIIGKEKLPFDPENQVELKSFILSVAEKGGLLEESLEKAGRLRQNADRATKRIVESLSLLLDDEDSAEKLEGAIDNIKEKLAAAAKELGNGDEAVKVRQGVEDIKENLKFLSSLKNTPFIEVPVFVEGQQKHADLYVFSRKGGKAKGGGSQSALLALDLTNLGHIETYVQKNGRSVVCQFRHESDEAEAVVRENMEKLAAALKEKHYSLDFVSFKKTGESFSITDGEPSLDESKAKRERFSIDYKA